MDYLSNYVFIDESGFNINTNHSIALSKKGECTIVTVSKTKANNITILCAIASYGVLTINIRRPKKRSLQRKEKLEEGLHRL